MDRQIYHVMFRTNGRNPSAALKRLKFANGRSPIAADSTPTGQSRDALAPRHLPPAVAAALERLWEREFRQ